LLFAAIDTCLKVSNSYPISTSSRLENSVFIEPSVEFKLRRVLATPLLSSVISSSPSITIIVVAKRVETLAIRLQKSAEVSTTREEWSDVR